MSRFVIIGTSPQYLINFRGHLLKAVLSEGHTVTAMAAKAEAPVVEQLKLMGIAFRAFPVQRNGLNPFRDLQTFFSIRKALDELKPDVILSYTIKPVIWGGLALKGGKSSTRFYALITGLGFAFQNGNVLRRFLTALVTCLYRISLSRATRVIFQNQDNLDLFASWKIVSKNKCALVNGSGVDLGHFTPTPLHDKDITFLAIGRLLGEKGFREYAKAASLVKARYPETIFRLVGPEDPSPDGIPFKEVREWQSSGWIEYLGKTDDVRPFVSDCHIFVLPSYHEGMPRTVLEAMAMGRPILTTNVPGCRDTVICGENGYLVPKSDAEALAERMIWFIENRDKLASMGRVSRLMAEEKFSVDKVNEKMLCIMGLHVKPRI